MKLRTYIPLVKLKAHFLYSWKKKLKPYILLVKVKLKTRLLLMKVKPKVYILIVRLKAHTLLTKEKLKVCIPLVKEKLKAHVPLVKGQKIGQGHKQHVTLSTGFIAPTLVYSSFAWVATHQSLEALALTWL